MSEEVQVHPDVCPIGPFCHRCGWEDVGSTLCKRNLRRLDDWLVTIDGAVEGVLCNLCEEVCYNCGRLAEEWDSDCLFYSRRYAAWVCAMCVNYSRWPVWYTPKAD